MLGFTPSAGDDLFMSVQNLATSSLIEKNFIMARVIHSLVNQGLGFFVSSSKYKDAHLSVMVVLLYASGWCTLTGAITLIRAYRRMLADGNR